MLRATVRLATIYIATSCLACDSGEVGTYARPQADAAPHDAASDVVVAPPDATAQGSDASDCPSAQTVASRVPATVWLVVDASASLRYPVFHNGQPGSIYMHEVLKNELTGPAGVITELQSTVSFGALFATATSETACPEVREVKPRLNAAAAIRDAFEPITFSSVGVTADALRHVMPQLRERSGQPQFVILMRPTYPDTDCTHEVVVPPLLNPAPLMEKRLLVEIQNVIDIGAKIFVVTVASSQLPDPVDRDDKIAQLGGTQRAYTTQGTIEDIQEMTEQLRIALRETVSCEVQLNGNVIMGQECRGRVTIDGAAIPCNQPDGWRMLNANTVEILGTACEAIRNRPDSQIGADFPCGVILY